MSRGMRSYPVIWGGTPTLVATPHSQGAEGFFRSGFANERGCDGFGKLLQRKQRAGLKEAEGLKKAQI